MEAFHYRLLADLVLVVHAALVIFVVSGLALILLGARFGWHWVRNPVFRWAHLAVIAVVVAQAWLGRLCPLTHWENALRRKAGQVTYEGEFVAHWLQSLLYYDLPVWVFAVVYTLFAGLVLWAWWRLPPRPWRRSNVRTD